MIITLSRQTGAGARTVGGLLGQRLGIQVLDIDVRGEVARRLHVPEDAVISLDERLEPARVRILRSLGAAVAPETGVATGGETAITADDVEETTRDVILDLASSGSAVIIGRGARWILGDRPDVLHVRLVAPLDVRTRRYAAKEGVDIKVAKSVIQDTDRARSAHVQRYFHVDWNDPGNYHLVLNTGWLSISAVTDQILLAVKQLT